MKSKSLILMVVAMGCGLVAAYTTAKLTAKGQDETEKVLVASSEIKIGTVIKEPEKFFVEIDYKKGTAPNAVTDIEKIRDKVVTRTVRPGQFMVPDDLSANFGIAPPKGTKAMAIKVDQSSAVGGFVMPGSRVDVMATIGDQNTKPKTHMILQNQEVLAVDRISVRPDGQSAVEAINTVTLAVTPQNALKLELALRFSNNVVRLLLRDQNDTSIVRLSPRESLTDNGNFDFGASGEGAAHRSLTAKEEIKPGTVIDDPEKFFNVVSVGTLPANGYQDVDIEKLKGQTVRVTVFKDAPVTTKHFEGDDADGNPTTVVATTTGGKAGKAPRPSTAPEPDHMLFITNGTKETQMHRYRNGVLVLENTVPTAPRPEPTNEPKPEKETKPAAGEKSS